MRPDKFVKKVNILIFENICHLQWVHIIQEKRGKISQIICIDYNLNHNVEFLNNLSETQKEKVEILVNPICGANCQNREKHYKLNSLFSLTYGKKYKLDSCNIPGKITYPFSKEIRNEILINDILTTYTNIGISHYKIEGRTFTTLLHL